MIFPQILALATVRHDNSIGEGQSQLSQLAKVEVAAPGPSIGRGFDIASGGRRCGWSGRRRADGDVGFRVAESVEPPLPEACDKLCGTE